MPKQFKRVNIEISNICNLQCSFCPAVERDKKVMTPEVLRSILVQIKPMCDEVCLHLMGEPTGHPQFPQMVEVCLEEGIPVNLTTNGLLLHGANGDAALSPIVRQLNISVHSYLDNFPKANPKPYLDKVCRLLDRIDAERPDLYVNLRLWDLADGTPVSDAGHVLRTEIGKRFGVDLDKQVVDIRRRKSVPLKGRISVNYDSRFVWPSLDLPERSQKGTCKGLGNHFGIHSDGSVVPCCLDKEADLKLGNINTESIQDVLRSPRAISIKEGFDHFELREELCRKCSFVSRFDRKATHIRNKSGV